MHESNYLNVVALIMMAAMTGHAPIDTRFAKSQTALATFDANFAWPQESWGHPPPTRRSNPAAALKTCMLTSITSTGSPANKLLPTSRPN